VRVKPSELSIIIVSWNTRELLAQALESAYDTVGDIACEVLVVDNGSTDGSAEMVETRFPQTQVLRNAENVGFARANNQALASSRGRFVLLLNSDAVLLPDALMHMARFMESEPSAGIVGPRILNPDGSFQSSYMSFPTLLAELLLMTKLHKVAYGQHFPSHPPAKSRDRRSVDWVSGACLMIRRQVVEDIGGLDEEFFMYSEEVDWCWRAKQAGWCVYYLPEAEAVHWGGLSSTKVPVSRRTLVYGSKLRFLRKHHGEHAARAFGYALIVTSCLKIGLWAALTWYPARALRMRAKANVASYRRLLAILPGTRSGCVGTDCPAAPLTTAKTDARGRTNRIWRSAR